MDHYIYYSFITQIRGDIDMKIREINNCGIIFANIRWWYTMKLIKFIKENAIDIFVTLVIVVLLWIIAFLGVQSTIEDSEDYERCKCNCCHCEECDR